MVMNVSFIFGSIVIFAYVFIKLSSLDNLYKSAKPIEYFYKNMLDSFNGLILLVDKNYLVRSMKTYKKVYKKMYKVENKSLIVTYDEKLFKTESDVEFFRDLCVSYVPCVIKINNNEEKKYITYKMEEFLT